jgi:hypothetical protein
MVPGAQNDVDWRIVAACGRKASPTEPRAAGWHVAQLVEEGRAKPQPATEDTGKAITRSLEMDEDELFVDVVGASSKAHTAVPYLRRITDLLDHPGDGPVRLPLLPTDGQRRSSIR